MKIYIGPDSNVTIFDLVGFAQDKYKGNNFCALASLLSENGTLLFVPCEYQAISDESVPSSSVRFLSLPGEPRCIFEHFLQSVRKRFLGIPFQEIYVEGNANYQFVGTKPHPSR